MLLGSASQFGSRVTIAPRTSVTVSPANAGRPISISNATQPNAQTSARLSTGFPRACSGLMYAAVPRIIPTPSSPGVVIVGDCGHRLMRRCRAPSLSPDRSPAP